MHRDEFKFMIEKLCTSIGSTLSIRKTMLLEMARHAEEKLAPVKDFIYEADFRRAMTQVLAELVNTLGDLTTRVNVLANCINQKKLPGYLCPGNNFLGKFEIDDVMPYGRIIAE